MVAETFLVAWRRLDRVPEEALPWLYAVARRVLADQRRTEQRRARLQNKVRPVPVTWEQATSIAEVLVAIRLLPARERGAILLIAWEGLTHAQAAAALGCTPLALRARLRRARRRLRRTLAAAANEEIAPPRAVAKEV